ncbi:hypothetical protein AX774_g4719 [Zancudomyces culisetae]|uniref:Uncharacterized protein n=1 Tax=Zancudomyces culisetae TaxID=1213189 RepID=A0A1R1PLH9_ZANCU|nr:hypothetical protein AX774_g4719 [Zancudomyces culisetae]|eukprot:OMH81816.1 hypothetical protein AX774_g4719 [Zancudomyces culisetae]
MEREREREREREGDRDREEEFLTTTVDISDGSWLARADADRSLFPDPRDTDRDTDISLRLGRPERDLLLFLLRSLDLEADLDLDLDLDREYLRPDRRLPRLESYEREGLGDLRVLLRLVRLPLEERDLEKRELRPTDRVEACKSGDLLLDLVRIGCERSIIGSSVLVFDLLLSRCGDLE